MARRAETGRLGYVDVTEEFWELGNGWFVAATADDVQWFDDNLAEEFVYLMEGGAVEPKGRTITMNRVVQNRKYVLEDMIAREYGATVVARGVYFARGDIPRGAAPQFQIRKYAAGARVSFSTVWVRRGDALKCVLFQSTTVGHT